MMGPPMNRYKKTALWIIAFLQFNAALFFVSGIVLEQLGLEPFMLSFERREYQQGFQATGLVLGVVLGWFALRMSLNRAWAAETKLRRYSIEFSDVLEEHFTAWHLTPAERDVALFLVKGLSTKEVAELRGTSEGTIKAQTNAIYRKAGVAGRPQLLSLFIEDLMDDVLLPAGGVETAHTG